MEALEGIFGLIGVGAFLWFIYYVQKVCANPNGRSRSQFEGTASPPLLKPPGTFDPSRLNPNSSNQDSSSPKSNIKLLNDVACFNGQELPAYQICISEVKIEGGCRSSSFCIKLYDEDDSGNVHAVEVALDNLTNGKSKAFCIEVDVGAIDSYQLYHMDGPKNILPIPIPVEYLNFPWSGQRKLVAVLEVYRDSKIVKRCRSRWSPYH